LALITTIIVFKGFAIAAIVTGLYAWYQHVELGIDRAHGIITNPIYYGGIVLLLSFFSLFALKVIHNPLLRILLVTGFVFGMYASIVSGSRGGWITLPTVLLLFMTYNIWNISLQRRLFILVAALILMFGIYQSDNLPVKQRVNVAISGVSDYFSEGKMSSVGYRLEMWKASYLSARDNNFLGSGENSYSPEIKRLSQEGRINKGLVHFVDPHSQYFNTLLDQGIIGVFSLFLIFLIPLKMLSNNLKDHDQPHVITMFLLILLGS
jgi:O-antigen ligase